MVLAAAEALPGDSVTDTPAGPGAVASAVARISSDGFERWMRQVEHAGYCEHPVRLAGRIDAVDVATGEIRPVYSTADEPDGVLLKACNNRRESVCQPCSERYRYDTYQLVAAGLRGGKGVPESVAGHPRVFVTLTAPSFGPVHGVRDGKDGRPGICRKPSGRLRLCEHGRPAWCGARHRDGDPALGTPLCPDCYDYPGAVLFNAYAPALWRRFTIALRRELAKAAGMTVTEFRRHARPIFVKVAEYQRRGVVHFHAPIRLDGAGEEVTPPPAGFTVDLLDQAVRAAAEHAQLVTPDLGPLGPARVLRFGRQVDVRPVRAFDGGQEMTAQAVAGYLGKYVTKTLDAPGLPNTRLTADDLDTLRCEPHYARMIRTAWNLGALEDLAPLKLRRWAHMLGFGGHVCTKSRRYSTTMTALRRARAEYRRNQHPGAGLDPWGREHDEEAVVVLALLDRRVLRVRQAVVLVRGRVRFDRPKSQTSIRTVPMPQTTVGVLREHRVAQDAERERLGEAWTDLDLVFPSTIGTPMEPRNLSRWFNDLRTEAGLPWLRLHDLRHACATFLLAQGVDLATIKDLLGHSQISVTADIYTHVLERVARGASDALDRSLFGPVTDEPDGDGAAGP